jgi:enoyl-[acyl-carrier protein] reductase I
MGLLDGKNALVFGLANERSIAWGITQALHREGASIGISYAGEMLKRRVMPLAEKIGCTWVEECDVTKDENIDAVAKKAAEDFGQIDVLVHSIAFAGREELTGPFYNTTREGFKNAMDISVYSFVALARAFQPILRPGASLICMTYYGSVKVAPHYNVMGVAKAALEATTRYLAYDFGPHAGARECHFGRADPHAGSSRRGRIPRYVQALCRYVPHAREYHHRRCGQRGDISGV